MHAMPTSPPVSAMALSTLSGFPRMCLCSSAAQLWLATTGLADAFAASRLVRHPECAQSGMTPIRFISLMADLPKSLSPALPGSAQPSPIMLRRLYVRCSMRMPRFLKTVK